MVYGSWLPERGAAVLRLGLDVGARLDERGDDAVSVVVLHAHMKMDLNRNLSGNEVYTTACSFLVIMKNLCSKLHCQKAFNLNPFSYKIAMLLGLDVGARLDQCRHDAVSVVVLHDQRLVCYGGKREGKKGDNGAPRRAGRRCRAARRFGSGEARPEVAMLLPDNQRQHRTSQWGEERGAERFPHLRNGVKREGPGGENGAPARPGGAPCAPRGRPRSCRRPPPAASPPCGRPSGPMSTPGDDRLKVLWKGCSRDTYPES